MADSFSLSSADDFEDDFELDDDDLDDDFELTEDDLELDDEELDESSYDDLDEDF